MITIGTVKFDFKADDEAFARSLHNRWDAFFAASFEQVADEVLSAYDLAGRMITIDSLPLDLGRMEPATFYRQFPLRLREALQTYCRKWLAEEVADASHAGVRSATVGQSAFRLLCFFLLHGYFPMQTDAEQQNLSLLLRQVLATEAYRFREFLESRGHYDFISRRLVWQFSDEELEQIVSIVQPSESKFINLYVRVQIHAYSVLHRPDISREDYRDAVWTLVLAYLFAGSGGRFSRKQVVMQALRGIAAHFNFALVEMIRLLTANMRHLTRRVGQLPEFWAILSEIRRDIPAGLRALDGDFHTHLLREAVAALRLDGVREEDASFFLSFGHLSNLLADPAACRELLRQLREPEIHRLVGILVPAEKEYVVSYAGLLDKHKDAGALQGKAGGDFRLLKWEFIFAVLLSMPASSFSRRRFVLSVLQRLSAHYNLSVTGLLRLLRSDEPWKQNYLLPELAEVLRQLDEELNPRDSESFFARLSPADWAQLMPVPRLARRFIRTHTEPQIADILSRLIPGQARFIMAYARLLDKGRDRGLLEGKAGSEFRLLKWEFIFACVADGNEVAFHQKTFVYGVLKMLAAHYNQEVADLLSYFLHRISALVESLPSVGLRQILQELYEENMLPLVDVDRVRHSSDKEVAQWLRSLFGEPASLPVGREAWLEKWLVYCLNERTEVFRTLWREGRLNVALLLSVVNRSAALRQLWLHKIGDKRLLAVYRRWLALYAVLHSRFHEYSLPGAAADYLAVWMVELTSRAYVAWSETEVMRFLAARARRALPPALAPLLDEIARRAGGKNITEIVEHIDKLKKEEIMEEVRNENEYVEVHNAGILLTSPFLPRLFAQLGYLTDTHREFKNEDVQVRAVFLLQYIVYGEEREWPETDLYLNKVLVGMASQHRPLPRKVVLQDTEKEWVDKLLDVVREMWDKMRHTSTDALRTAFLQRSGHIVHHEREHCREVRMEEKAYDVLIDFVPWGFRLCKFPWMQERIEVKWR